MKETLPCSSSLQNLTVNEVKDLLGNNLRDLKDYENQTLVDTWIRSQLQSELDTLQIGLVGGRADPTTTTTANPTTAGTLAPDTTTQSGSGTTVTGGSGATTGSTNTTTGELGDKPGLTYI